MHGDALLALLLWRFSGPPDLSHGAAFGRTAGVSSATLLRRSLTAWIFVAMLIGAEVGHDLPNVATHLRVLALIFLRLIKTIIAPLLFATLVVGIAGHSNLRQVGRLGLRSIIYFEIITTVAIFLGLGAINLTKAGVGVQLPRSPARRDTATSRKLSAEDTILHVFPENIAKAVADNAVLQVVVFSLIFAIALAMISEDEAPPDADAMREPGGDDVQVHQHRHAVRAASVWALPLPTLWAHTGFGVLGSLAKLLLTFYAALLVFIVGVLLPVAQLFRVPLRAFSPRGGRAGDHRLRHHQL